MPEESFNHPDPNPFNEDQAELEYLSLVDDIDEQFIADRPLETSSEISQTPSQIFSPAPKPLMVLPQRLMLWAIACATVPACIVAGFAYQLDRKSTFDRAIQAEEIRLESLANSLNEFVLKQYDSTKTLSQGIGQTSGLRANRNPSNRQKLLISNRLNTFKKNSKFAAIAIYNLNGNLILQSSPKQSLKNQSSKKLAPNLLQKVKQFNSPLLNQPVGAENSEYAIEFIAPIRDSRTQRIQAILKSQMLLNAVQTKYTNAPYLISHEDKSIFSSFPASESISTSVNNLPNQPAFLSLSVPPIQGLPNLNWRITTKVNVEYNYAYASIFGICILVLILAIAIISYLAARQLSFRIIQATNAINAITTGGLEQKLSIQGQDEVSQLSENVNLMTIKMRSLLESKTQTIDQLQRLIAKGVEALQQVIHTNGEDTSSGDIEAIAAHLQVSLVKKQTEVNLSHREQERLHQQISQKEKEVKLLQDQIKDLSNQVVQQIEKASTELLSSSEQYKLILSEIVEQAEQKQEELTQKNAQIQILELQLNVINTRMESLQTQLMHILSSEAANGISSISSQNTELMAKQIMHLREAIAISAKKAKRLSESSQKISKVVDQVHEIGIEANFLSVNAGIKANREHNSDFSIFSDQVGKLANMAIAVMKEMEQLSVNIQTETREVMGNLELGTTKVSEATKLIAGVQADLVNAEAIIKAKLEAELKLYGELNSAS